MSAAADGGSEFNADCVSQLSDLLSRAGVTVLTGAGVSTESGIPDYRDELGQWKRPQPMGFREFTESEAARRRYWARSMLGFGPLERAQPNAAHRALAECERRGLTSTIITQNVDGLHQAAGARKVIDLHGRIDQVVCLGCGERTPRLELQQVLIAQNPEWAEREAVIAPDGDADPGSADYSSFRVPACRACGGMLKPDVVFFGENVPKDRVELAMSELGSARALLVVGSSLMVFSGYRFVRAAQRLGLPVAVLNRGRTRADELAAIRVEGCAGQVLTDVVGRFRREPGT
jgi:NAD-dependent SIR2 family protein deacetylase